MVLGSLQDEHRPVSTEVVLRRYWCAAETSSQFMEQLNLLKRKQSLIDLYQIVSCTIIYI